ncbi:dUTP diphosphatase [Alkaliphilus serpentinus]|uniref:dUTPase n=1 Tax=Alkaliphilus serpentinus TaxID=1482731 RepID=A0A833HPV0_9FIRM|nr:dUTP diphosphatase [Alkaliphilus serpentinus]KAB3531157.1 dUTPase [Alkaliphilus serpentinus]
MNLKKLFDIQKLLDQRIIDEHQLQEVDLLPPKLLALQVELGELANETRCFKYWSRKKPSPKQTILEEYVDCLHFILSVGLEKGIENIQLTIEESSLTLVEEFKKVIQKTTEIERDQDEEVYRGLFSSFILLGNKLGFFWEEIVDAYLKKNEINHKRQEEGY